jgi:outer membrane protein OmpA-like peptidoglycan-associated protein
MRRVFYSPVVLLQAFVLSAILLLSGCKPEAVKPTVEGPPQPAYHTDLAEAVKFVVENLSRQITPQDLKNAKVIPVDLFFNEQSAEEAASAKALQQQLISAMSASMPEGAFSPMTTRNIQMAQWVVLSGYSVVKSEEAGKPGSWVRLKIALADVKSGTTVARVMTYLDAKQFNSAPSRFYKEAPMYMTDAAHKDRSAVLAGEKRSLGEGLRLRAELAEAIEAYEAGQYAEAETGFKKVLDVSPANTSALSGIYQVYWRQGKKTDAERAFGKLASAGIEAGKLSAKLLFKLGTTEFIEDNDLAQQYQVWLKAIANQISEKKVCLDVTGHASASGTADYNEKLSLSRASRIVSRMQQLNAATQKRMKAHGKGSSETIVGTGTNDASDAIDRRVEFSVRSCE